MTLVDNLKDQIKSAMRDGNKTVLAQLRTLHGEASTRAKNEQREMTDVDINKTAEKFIKGLEKIAELTGNAVDQNEYELYDQFVPKDPLADLTLEECVSLLRQSGETVTPAMVMKETRGRFKFPDVLAALK